MKEIWREIQGYGDRYLVSNYGKIKSSYRGEFKLMKPQTTKRGYAKIQLQKNRQIKSMFLHRIIAMVFIENKENKPFINHKDCNKLNNRADNLEWVTAKENMQHAKENNLLSYSHIVNGEKHKSTKVTDEEILRMVDLVINKDMYIRDVVKESNIDESTLAAILGGRSRKYLNIRFMYKKNDPFKSSRGKLDEFKLLTVFTYRGIVNIKKIAEMYNITPASLYRIFRGAVYGGYTHNLIDKRNER